MFVVGDVDIPLTVTCKDQKGAIIDLTGCTVEIEYGIGLSATVMDTMTVSSPTTGIATYLFGADAFSSEGQLIVALKITFPGGTIVRSFPPFKYGVEAHI